ncbi:MAG: hypothetical protein A3F91_10120 [Flavobacteria bacterium RIFCSPLOWO2_12_FULL_35_11]|nr:MAG: hypothetical protein A3F91_10120 [Flavobacteria bacterium RIFCSPLOWO2_12_FULL_35_11]
MELKRTFSTGRGQGGIRKNLQMWILLLSSLMEDFSIFGIGWQLEVAEKNIKECEQKNCLD